MIYAYHLYPHIHDCADNNLSYREESCPGVWKMCGPLFVAKLTTEEIETWQQYLAWADQKDKESRTGHSSIRYDHSAVDRKAWQLYSNYFGVEGKNVCPIGQADIKLGHAKATVICPDCFNKWDVI